jgi:hypothetical protein
MKNLILTNEVMNGTVYMVEMKDGGTESYRVIAETPTHFILSFTKEDSVEVFEKAKMDVVGIYQIKEWLTSVEGE